MGKVSKVSKVSKASKASEASKEVKVKRNTDIILQEMPEAKRGKAGGNRATPIFTGGDLGSPFLFSLPEAKRGNADFHGGAT